MKCVRHNSLTGLVRIGRFIGETCNAKDGLVKVHLERVRDGTVRFLGREESGGRRSSFDLAPSSHHRRPRNLRISYHSERKFKTPWTSVTKTSLGSTRNSARRTSPPRRVSAPSPKVREMKEATEPLPLSSSAAHPEATGKRSRLSFARKLAACESRAETLGSSRAP